jgi:hypothetical protein
MKTRTILAGCLVWLASVFPVSAEIIQIRPKQPANEAAPSPLTRPAPRLPNAPPANPEGAALKTVVEVDILSLELQGDPSSQKWGKVFEDMGLSVRIRNGRDGKPGVTEKVRGSLRYVNASGVLNREGGLSFGKVTFRLSEGEKIKEWLEELKTYGAQGTPDGKPLWGLNRLQFEVVNAQMTKPLTIQTQGQSLTTLVKSLQADAKLPVRLHTATADWLLDAAHDRPITGDVSGFSTGTGLAVALNEIGTGLRPIRTPDGKIEYEILPLDQLKDPWPLGWEPHAETPRNLITPELFQMGVVGFDQSPLGDVLAAIQTESKTPIVIDMRRCLAKKIDVHKVLVSSPTKRTAWALVVSQCVRQAGLYNSYRQDEAGKGFVLVAPFEPKVVPAE